VSEPVERSELDGTPVGRRVVLGLLGLGAVGVLTGSAIQGGLSRLVAHDPSGLSQLLPLGATFRYYSVAGSVPTEDASTYSLAVSGLVDHPVSYTLADLQRMPQVAFTRTFQCVTGWYVDDVPWTGVRLSDLLDLAAPTPQAAAIRFHSFDGVYTENMTLDQARADGVIVALTMYGRPVTHDHGGPVRIYAAPMYGYKSTKWLSGIELTSSDIPGYWETRGYPLDGIIGE
jgi:DMSO/TMAO reductase YedYZ molybdopterin-dependent catalytic subunit